MNKLYLLLVIFCAFISTCDYKIINDSSQKKKFLTISAVKFKQKLDANDFVLIDVKTKKEHEKEHIPRSHLIDFFGTNFNNKISDLDKEKKYLIYCHSGAKSSITLRLMNRLGFKEVYELKGGITSWKSAGFKVIRDSN